MPTMSRSSHLPSANALGQLPPCRASWEVARFRGLRTVAATLVLDALTMHEAETERVNRTLR